MNIDQVINQLQKKIEIIAGFPKDMQVIYPPDDRKPNSFPKNPLGKGEKDTRTRNKGGQTVAQVATWNEFGTKTKKGNQHIPARPFMRMAMRNNRDEIIRLVKDSFKVKNLQDPQRFDKIGKKLQSMIRDSIVNGNWIPNSHRTKMQKLKHATWKKLQQRFVKYDEINAEWNKIKPLIDTGLMLKSVNYEVKQS